ncbi:MAG: ATP-binding protein [Candidatus Cloacimonetes bacterium]|nr:ATP-binding protein [Candidatus Cloacimonadota bacterium]
MRTIKRTLENRIMRSMENSKAIFILGPRQVGKTTLLKRLMEKVGFDNSLYYDIEMAPYLEVFSGSLEGILALLRNDRKQISGRTFVFIDEVQSISDFSKTTKLLVDHHSDEFKFILTGSSSTMIKRQFKESLVGRKEEHILYPLSFLEFCRFKAEDNIADLLETGYVHERYFPLHLRKEKMELLMAEYMVFGGYPEVVLKSNDLDKAELLNDIVSSYILKDIRHIFRIERPDQLNKLIRNLAINSGKEINLQKLSGEINLHTETVKNYLLALETSYLVTMIKPFFSNQNAEQRKMPKAYFIDTGIRNMLINNFNAPDIRTDKGELFENLIFINLLHKKNVLSEIKFWKSKAKQEIDFVVKESGSITAYEVKYGNDRQNHFTAFLHSYPGAKCYFVRFNYTFQEDELPGYF